MNSEIDAQLIRPTWAEVDLGAISANASALRALAAVPLMAVVKADAYGHGAVEVARTLAESGLADWLAVALVEEARELRNAGIESPILVLTEPPPAAAPIVADLAVSQTVASIEMIDALEAAGAESGRVLPVHLKVDTGMHRAGTTADMAVEAARRVASKPHLNFEGTFTHLATADEARSDFPATQLARFREVLAAIEKAGLNPGLVHAANSAGLIAHPEARFGLVRAGIALYGLSPALDFELPAQLGLVPAMSLKTRISSIRPVRADEGVSYGLTFRARSDTKVATLPVGYADGYPRGLSNRGEVLIRGQRRPVAGVVTMDQTMVDLGSLDAAVGDEVVLMGRGGNDEVSADELAAHLGSISYEVVSRVGPRVPRVYVR